MIFIQRLPAPSFLTDPLNRWKKETEEAIAHYNNPNESTAFEFKMYRHRRLKDELEKVFSKCAYCESDYKATSDGDVEHFRPKGRIDGKNPRVPGYYWLANDWDNLMLACSHCNQRRKHILYGETTRSSYGKLDKFPLSDEDQRVCSADCSLDEEEKVRLLINPCKDRPEEHLEYEIEEAVIFSKTPMGNASIDVYVLQRHLLVQSRKKRLIFLLRQMDIVKYELEQFNKMKTLEQRTRLATQLGYLKEFTRDGEVYAGMCRYFVKIFLAENNLG